MLKRHTAFLLALILAMSLITGTVASGAQNPGVLTETSTGNAVENRAIGTDGAFQLTESSASTTSVRLSESVAWPEAGLILNLPEGWRGDFETLDGDETIIAAPEDNHGSNRFHIIQATTVGDFEFFDLTDLAELTTTDYDLTSPIVETAAAGHPAVTYEFRDTDGSETLHLRALMIDIADRDVIGLVIFATNENAWDEFRPIVSAVSSSIQPINRGRSALALVSDTAVAPPPAAPLLRSDDEAAAFNWAEAGVTLTLADGWTTQSGNGQDYDLALLSPAVQDTGQGSFVKLRLIPMLGSSPEHLTDALQPIAEQLSVEDIKTPYTLAGMEGAGIDYTDEENTGYVFHFVLLPYGDRGDVLYIQSTADPDVDESVIAMLNSMKLDIPRPDYAAVDAAWQASLADNGTLTAGEDDAPVKIVEYLSFTCGHCVNYSRSIERLIALDVETGRARLTMAALAGDEYATTATHATYCAAEQGKGFSAAEALFQSYSELGYSDAYTREGINDLLGKFELDMDALNTCIDEERYQDEIVQNGVAFTDLGLTGTPTMTFGVNDEDPIPITFPDGQIWSGAIALHWVHDIINAYIKDGITPNEFVTQ